MIICCAGSARVLDLSWLRCASRSCRCSPCSRSGQHRLSRRCSGAAYVVPSGCGPIARGNLNAAVIWLTISGRDSKF